MANKYVALLLVVCLIATVTVDAQESLTPCLDHCIADNCGVHPSYFCVILCNFGCSAAGLSNENKIQAHGVRAEAPTSSWAEAPQFSRKIQA
ncbi:hypothetical protein PHAVU_007G059100 [Phaseolus vulgaris]|uniref:Uncharacterized protein n=1 Tax=Phaseolus vulgaris TaxID=3885 RepID=V7BEE1_PHAVU|nr:hypothetical protein PHAVU_007G059100g [Phaseolus vulgaris]ESW15273.1 hypothetical protein PHAVU_007G059100g [Phaseolus vulgaris]